MKERKAKKTIDQSKKNMGNVSNIYLKQINEGL
jgi:hypothetical protein